MVVALMGGPVSTSVMAQTPEMPVFDLIYLDEPPESAAVELVAQRPTGPVTDRSTDAGALAAQAPESAIVRLASLTAPSVAEAFVPDPQRRIIGTDVTDPAPEEGVDALSAEELALELQQELARVGCYRLRVDGQWGPGSRRALNSYLTRSNQSADDNAPTMALLQMVRASDAGVCPAPVARAPAARAPRTTTPSQAARAPRMQPAAPVATAPPASGGGTRLEGALRGGFR